MRRGRIFIILAIVLLIVFVIVFFVGRQILNRVSTTTTPEITYVDVIVAGQNINQGTEINESLLTTISLPQDKVVSVMYTKDRMSEIVGKIARYPIQQGVVITSALIGDSAELPSAGPNWTSLISPGMTAISIPTSRLTSAAYGVGDGSHVNVIACMLFVDVDPSYQTVLPNYTSVVTGTGYTQDALPTLSTNITSGGDTSAQGRVELDPTLQQPFYVVPSEPQRPRPVCQMIFQDVVVLHLGNFPVDTNQLPSQSQTPTPVPGQDQASVQQAPTPDIVSLIVSPQDAVTLTYLVYGGAKLTLTMRGSGDESRIATEAATLQYVLSQYAIPVPAKLPYATVPRVDEFNEPTKTIISTQPNQ